ncbi:hypothetical protein RND71_019507 [Anisodus tanguticus]|uniref:BZIP domain-containing protein n=1 Tax=Anisodus tanguticus TaxID=243964 RepID=A0AAE1RZG4_9SOLA|nr:hypothetical protein RND71_019507 [Anisodus tanguticus]
MGAGEESTPTKPSKATSTQETQATPSYPDWSSMQAYYGAGATPPFFPSTVASPTPHPYMWGGQHPLMPPYGAPVPYPALYPPAGVYAHPNMPMTPNTLQPNPESDSKAPDGKDQSTNKKLKGCSGGKAGESGKMASGSGNDGATRSAESGSEGSSDANDENDNHEFSADKSRSFDLMLANGNSSQNNPATGNPVAMPASNLNIGMDLWNAPSAGPGMIKMRSNQSGVSPAPGTGREWIQDERELKRQKRKQSNRESARRSRLRKQYAIMDAIKKALFLLKNRIKQSRGTVLSSSVKALHIGHSMELGRRDGFGLESGIGLRGEEKEDMGIEFDGDRRVKFCGAVNEEEVGKDCALVSVDLGLNLAECEELQHKVEILGNENHGLKEELRKLSEECEKLTSENNSIKYLSIPFLPWAVSCLYRAPPRTELLIDVTKLEELTRLCAPEAVSKLESNANSMHLQSNAEEANS